MSPLFAAWFLAGSAVLPLPGLDAITPSRYPDAHAVTVDCRERVKYRPDGTYESEVESWTKVLTEKGRRDESTLTLDYSRRYGEAAIVYVGAIGTNGVEREIDVRATTKESTDNGSMAANIYDPLDRKIVCTVPGLQLGETLHVRTRRRALHPRCVNQWADISVMEWTDPMVRSSYEITAPAERPLGCIRVRHPLGNLATNVVRAASGEWIYSFTVTNSPQAIPEPDMPALYTQVQNIRVSTARNWEEISKWYWELSRPHLERTSSAISNRVAELNVGDDRRERLRRLFRFVSQEIRYMGLTLEDVSPGYAPHDVELTFARRYGVCRDKAALLTAMLRIAGFQAFPVLIHVGAKHDPEVPQPFFNHAIVAVAGADGYELMDPTDENTKDLLPAYLSDMSYLVCRPEGETLRTTPVVDPRNNSLDVRSTGTLAKDGSILLESAIAFSGINDTAYRHALVRQKPEDRVKFFERIAKSIASGAELSACRIEPNDLRDTERPLAVRLSLRLPECVLRGETLSQLNVPFVSERMGLANFLLSGSLALPQRKYPLSLNSTARVCETLELRLGGHLGQPQELPTSEVTVSDGYRFRRNACISNDLLRCERELTIGAVEFSPKEYGDLREAVKTVEAAARRRPLFEENALAGADVQVLLDSTEVAVESDREWTVTNRVVKKILSYDGKKRNSELKWSFNPSWKRIEVLAASVSNCDGRVSRVTDRELNRMDCGWAASAPRYPASEMMVVNLPAVEIGSVIDYTVVTTVTNAPAPFYGTYVFDSHEPVELIRVQVNDWQREAVRPARLANEPHQPGSVYWRKLETISFNRFDSAAKRLRQAEPAPLAADCGRTPLEIRNWLAKHVKLAGPGLYELPLELQLTPPTVVLKERYATRLDYVRTLTALLKGAGYEASLVFATDDADDPDWLRRRTTYDKPNVRAFASALCRLRLDGRTYFLGTENQYAPLGPTAYAGSTYLDPATGGFGRVEVAPADRDAVVERTVYDVRADGSVDLQVENEIRGTGVATFRKTYSEILPELRLRRYQTILGDISQAATATSELETDVESYPARRQFSCYIPDYATVEGDTITLQLPALVSSMPSLTGRVRRTPFALAASSEESEEVTVRFPSGYTQVEHLPENFTFADPADPSATWMSGEAHALVRDGVLTVLIRRSVSPRRDCQLAPTYYELMKDWHRISGAAANRTIVVRRPPAKP